MSAARKRRAGRPQAGRRKSGVFSAMILGTGRRAALTALAVGLALAGCTRVRDHQGFVLDPTLVSAIQPGTDTKDSVLNTLGRPSFTSEFDQRDWYYLSRNTRNMAFNIPHPSDQTLLHIRFDEKGNVVSVDRKGLEQVADIRPSGDKTPTLGRHKSLLDELFGNIGAVGAAGRSPSTTDNPH
jgi:outer membrane protein assembly factor BamE (lipoprotein component of BamABCDE complex)